MYLYYGWCITSEHFLIICIYKFLLGCLFGIGRPESGSVRERFGDEDDGGDSPSTFAVGFLEELPELFELYS